MITLLVLLLIMQPYTQCECNSIENKPWYCYCWNPDSIRFIAADFSILVNDCLRGPNKLAPHGCKARFDSDDNETVDLQDFAVWEAGISN